MIRWLEPRRLREQLLLDVLARPIEKPPRYWIMITALVDLVYNGPLDYMIYAMSRCR